MSDAIGAPRISGGGAPPAPGSLGTDWPPTPDLDMPIKVEPAAFGVNPFAVPRCLDVVSLGPTGDRTGGFFAGGAFTSIETGGLFAGGGIAGIACGMANHGP